jgi:hypothetical protein
MPDDAQKQALRSRVRDRLPDIVATINRALSGTDVHKLESILARLGRGGVLPHWYPELAKNGVLPNLDGKSIGSVVEMLFVAVLESEFIGDLTSAHLRINPARGVDLPDLGLGLKSPSENFCTSEPFFSAYERLIGGEYDVVVLLTDYQDAKAKPPLRLQIKDQRYLPKTQIADANLCGLGRKHRDWLLRDSEARAQKLFRFLAYVNQSDWLARQLIKLLDAMPDEKQIESAIKAAERDFETRNKRANSKGKELIPDADLAAVRRICEITPRYVGVIDAADDWVLETLKEAARGPSENEWQRLRSGPLDGAIGMSFALQWRYNFGRLFGSSATVADDLMAGLGLSE